MLEVGEDLERVGTGEMPIDVAAQGRVGLAIPAAWRDPDIRPHEIDDQVMGEVVPVGEALALGVADRALARGREASALSQKSALADARLAGYHRDAALAGLESVELACEPVQLRVAPDHLAGQSGDASRRIGDRLAAEDLEGAYRRGLPLDVDLSPVL